LSETPLDRIKMLIMLMEQLPEDLKYLMNDPKATKEMAELAIRILRLVPEIQKVMAIEALKRSGI